MNWAKWTRNLDEVETEVQQTKKEMGTNWC